MACETRKKTGSCSHSQCQYPDQSGYDCVEILTADDCIEAGIDQKFAGTCEAGDNCVKECPYSYQTETPPISITEEALRNAIKASIEDLLLPTAPRHSDSVYDIIDDIIKRIKS